MLWERAEAKYGLWSLGAVSTEHFLGPCGAAGSYFKIQQYLSAHQTPCLQDSDCLCHCRPHQDVISSLEVISPCSCWHSAVQLRHKHIQVLILLQCPSSMSRKDGQVLAELFGKEPVEHLLVTLRAREGAVPVRALCRQCQCGPGCFKGILWGGFCNFKEIKQLQK